MEPDAVRDDHTESGLTTLLGHTSLEELVHPTDLSVDDALELAGGWGRFQSRVVLCASLMEQSWVFIALLPTLLLPRLSLSATQQSLIEFAFFTGTSIGMTVGGLLGDWIGRRPSSLAMIMCNYVLGLLHFVSANPTYLGWLRGIAGFTTGAMTLPTVCIMFEHFSTELQRTRANSLYFLGGWTGGLLLLVGVAYASRDASWRYLSIATLAVPTWLVLCFLPESPRYLLARGRQDCAVAAIHEVARVNRSPLGSAFTLSGSDRKAGVSPSVDDGASTPASSSACQALRQNCLQLVVLSSVSALAWFGSTASYYGAVLWPLPLGSGLYLTSALGALVEAPVYLFIPPISRYVGATKLWCLFLVWAGVSWMAYGRVREAPGTSTVLATVILLSARLAATGATTICYVAVAEVLPTSVRGTGMGIASLGARLGSMCAPFLVHLSPSVAVSTSILAGLSIISAACALILLCADRWLKRRHATRQVSCREEQ